MTYSSSIAASRQRFNMRGQNTTAFAAKEAALGPVSNTIILIVLACLLGLLYLTQVTKTNAYSYSINKLQQQQSSLKQENSDLQVASARLQALSRVQGSKVAKNLVSVVPASTVQN